MNTNITPYLFIHERIERAFVELAEAIGNSEIDIDDGDKIPLGIFWAQKAMLDAWKSFVESEMEKEK